MIEIAPYEHDHGAVDSKVRQLKQQQSSLQTYKDHLKAELINEKLDEIDKEIRKFTNQRDQLEKEKTKLTKNIEEIKSQISEYERKLETYDQNIAEKYAFLKNKEETSKQKRFLKYLIDNYPNVHGRMADLCKPANKRFYSPVSIIIILMYLLFSDINCHYR